MAPRSKQCTKRAPGTEESAEKAKISGWEWSKLSAQDQKLLKKMGLLHKEAIKMPGDESSPHPPIGFRVTFVDFLTCGLVVPVHEFLRGLLFIYGIHLHQLTPNSLLHISIFITLCECFLGIHPHWGLWKRIFYLRCNNSKNVAYNVGGVCICVHPDVDYFDVKFADSVQGWRKKWLYIKDESSDAQEYGLAPFDAAEEIQRRKSWDAKATTEERAATDALITRIRELQNTDGAELSGVQIIAHFLRIRVQPLQARKNPLWMYTGAKDVDRISDDLSVKDLEKLVRRFTSLNKNHEVPSSCRVEPFSGSHALPKNHQTLSSLPPLPEGGEVDDRVIVADDSQESFLPESEPAESSKKKVNPQGLKDLRVPLTKIQSQPTPSLLLLPLLRMGARGKEAMTKIPARPNSPNQLPKNLLLKTKNSSTPSPRPVPADEGEENEEPEAHGLAPTSTSNTLVISEERRVASEKSPPPQHNPEAPTPVPSPRAPKKKKAKTGAVITQELAAGSMSGPLLDDPLMKELVNLGSQFIGFRDEAAALRDALHRAEGRADDLEAKLKASEAACKKAEKDAAAAEGKMSEQYHLSQESDDRLLDTLDILELNCDLARKCMTSARNALRRVFPHFFPKETQPEIFSQLAHHFLAKDDPALAYRQASLKIGVEGTIALVAASGQKIDWVKTAAPKGLNSEKWKALVKDAKLYSKKIIAFLDPKSSASASVAQTEV
ncbi:hypothetical protein ACQ4PT_058769 [Festuca glaucescens]